MALPDAVAPAPQPPGRGDRPETTERLEHASRPERSERPQRPEFEERPRHEGRGATTTRRPTFAAGDLRRYRIEVGRNQGATPKEIVGAIANEGGIEGKYIGQIHLFDTYSTVELPELPPDVLATLKRTRVKQKPLDIRLLAADETAEAPKRRWESKTAETPTGKEKAAPRDALSRAKPWEKKREARPLRSDVAAGKPAFGARRKLTVKPAHSGRPKKP
jgi:ATP-dependent RNA helicase DeaD